MSTCERGWGPKAFSTFHVDAVVGTTMTGRPDLVDPLTSVDIDGLVRPQYRSFPIADHLADKLCAIMATYQHGSGVRASSRIKDLVDIVLISATQKVTGQALRTAIVANTAHRGLSIPDRFAVPDEKSWRAGFPRVASDAPGLVPPYDEAVALAGAPSRPSPCWLHRWSLGSSHCPMASVVASSTPACRCMRPGCSRVSARVGEPEAGSGSTQPKSPPNGGPATYERLMLRTVIGAMLL